MNIFILTGAWKWNAQRKDIHNFGSNIKWFRILIEVRENCLELICIYFHGVTAFLGNHERFLIDRSIKSHIATVLVFRRVRFFFITHNFHFRSKFNKGKNFFKDSFFIRPAHEIIGFLFVFILECLWQIPECGLILWFFFKVI